MLTDDKTMIKLIDLGVSTGNNSNHKNYDLKGTSRYLAPEQLGYRSHAAGPVYYTDIWQFACVLLEFSTGIEPFASLDNISCTEKIKNGRNPLKYILEHHYDKCSIIEKNVQFRNVLMKCFRANYEERPSAQQLLGNEFFNNHL